MKAVRVHEFGGPDTLRFEDVPTPAPGRGEARVRIEAIGVNYIDVYHRTGAYGGELPFVPGMEAAGVVDAVGGEVDDVCVGERVAYAMQRGAYAEYAVVPTWKLVPIPATLEVRQAAGIMLQGMTAHYLTHSTFPLEASHTALVHAAAGGVGQLLVQLAKARGARVIASVSTNEKAAIATEAGADHVIVYGQSDFRDDVLRFTSGEGVDVVYDSVGRETFESGLRCLRPRGTMVLYGQSSGAVPPFEPQILNRNGSLFLTRPSLAHYAANRQEVVERSQDLFEKLTSGRLRLRIDCVLPLERAAQAHRHLESRSSKGKLLLTV